ncbi:MAG: hypothetical protein R3256_00700 [Thalassovita sp.]|nr:hypothetical protein [Thalassovita sp.]
MLPRLAISITTFKREAEVRDTVARLESFLADFPYRDHIRLQVVDNGQSANIQPSEITTPYANPNLGGAGGFARGLIEAEAAGCSHCLFMDDDASFHMENIARCYAFLTLARDPNAALAGAMINTTVKWAMWENGAVFNTSCRPLHTGVDLRERDQLLDMEFDSVHDDYPTLYGAWWFFAFPIAAARHYPFPFFVRGDDISFSLANDFRISTLNGVVSFQQDFTEKESAQTLYLDLRNHLLHHLIFDSLSRSAVGTAWVAVLFIVRSLLRFHYSSAEAQLLALQDVMQGPDFFDQNLDMAERRARIRELARDEEWQEIGTVDLSERHRVFSRLPAPIRHYFGLITINGHLAPFWSWLGSRPVLKIGQRGLVDESFGAARLTFLNTARDKAYALPHSKRRFFAISWRLAGTLLRYLRIHRVLKDEYRDRYPNMTSRAYWEKALDRR